MKRLLVLGAVGSVLLPSLTLLAVRPATAATPVYDAVATTALVAGIRTAGTVGATGGLLTLDGGSAHITATLDGSPSAHVVAAPYEPGGFVRTVLGQVNPNLPPDNQLRPADADVSYPGTTQKASVATVPPTGAGPFTVSGGAASAEVTPHSAAGTATGASYVIAGVLTGGGSTSDVTMSADADAGTATQAAHTAVGSLDVAGVLELSDVVGEARVTATGTDHSASQTLVIGGASVAGQAVEIGNDGVTAAGTPLIPGQTLQQATDQANTVLRNAGITVRTVGGLARHDSTSAGADTGGVLITLATPAGDVFTVVVGGVALTEFDTPAATEPILSCIVQQVCEGSVPGTVGAPPTTTTTFVPGTPALPGTPTVAAPTVSPPRIAPASYVLAGRRFSAQTALIAFAAWQMLTLGMPTLYAYVERRRRLRAAA